MMSSKLKILISIVFLLSLVNTVVYAQGKFDKPCFAGCKHHPDHPMIPDLTEDQQSQLNDLRTNHMKTMLPQKNKLAELKAQLQTLSTGDDVNMKKVNDKIEEIGKLKTEMMKQKSAHRQEVRKILTEKQRVYFDTHSPRHHRKNHDKPGGHFRHRAR